MRNEQFLISTKWGRKIRNFETNLQLLRRGGVEKGLTIGPKFSARMRAQLQEIILFNKSNRTKLKELQKWRNYLHDLKGEVRKRQGLANRRALRRNPIAVTESGLGPRSQLPTDLLAETAEFIKNLEERVVEGIQYAEDNIHGREGRLRSDTPEQPLPETLTEKEAGEIKGWIEQNPLPDDMRFERDLELGDDLVPNDRAEEIRCEMNALNFVLHEKEITPKEFSADDIQRILESRYATHTSWVGDESYDVRSGIEEVLGSAEPSLHPDAEGADRFWDRFYQVLKVISPSSTVPSPRSTRPSIPPPIARSRGGPVNRADSPAGPDRLAPLRRPPESPPPPPAARERGRATGRPDVENEALTEDSADVFRQTQEKLAMIEAELKTTADPVRQKKLEALAVQGRDFIAWYQARARKI